MPNSNRSWMIALDSLIEDNPSSIGMPVLKAIAVDGGSVLIKEINDPHIVHICDTPTCTELAKYVVQVIRTEVDFDKEEFHHFQSFACEYDKNRLLNNAINGELIGSKLH